MYNMVVSTFRTVILPLAKDGELKSQIVDNNSLIFNSSNRTFEIEMKTELSILYIDISFLSRSSYSRLLRGESKRPGSFQRIKPF
jgi:hypothetical protein